MRERQAILLLVATSLLLPATWAQPAPASYGWTGELTFDEPTYVAAGETLRVAPGTQVNGSARIEVYGRLVVEGEPTSPVRFLLPVVLLGTETSTFRHTRFLHVNTTALDVRAGTALVENASFTGNVRALRVAGSGAVVARDSTFEGHAGEAIYAEGGAAIDLARVALSDNGRGLAVYSAASLRIHDSTFRANGQHLVLDLGPWSVPAADAYELERNGFEATRRGPTPFPALQLRHEGSPAEERPSYLVRTRDNRVEDAAIGLRAEGRGLRVESYSDAFVGNDVGVDATLASVLLDRPTLGNARDVEGVGVTLRDPIYARQDGAPASAAETPAAWAWAIGAASALALVGALVFALARRAARRPPARSLEPAPIPATSAPPLDAPVPTALAPRAPREPRTRDLATPITTLERRILDDILANPGTSQRAVADRLGYTRQALHYHVKRLEARGLVDKTLEGRETRCAIPDEVARALATPEATRTGSQEKG